MFVCVCERERNIFFYYWFSYLPLAISNKRLNATVFSLDVLHSIVHLLREYNMVQCVCVCQCYCYVQFLALNESVQHIEIASAQSMYDVLGLFDMLNKRHTFIYFILFYVSFHFSLFCFVLFLVFCVLRTNVYSYYTSLSVCACVFGKLYIHIHNKILQI